MLDGQNLCKKAWVVATVYMFVLLLLRRQGTKVPGASWSSSLAKAVNSRTVKGPFPQLVVST